MHFDIDGFEKQLADGAFKVELLTDPAKIEIIKVNLERMASWEKILLPGEGFGLKSVRVGRSGYFADEDIFYKFKGLGAYLEKVGAAAEEYELKLPGAGSFDEHKGRAGVVAYKLSVKEGEVPELFYEPFPLKAMGGVVVSKAMREFQMTERLWDAGVSVLEPVGVYKYLNRSFAEENLAVLILRFDGKYEDFLPLGELLDFEVAEKVVSLPKAWDRVLNVGTGEEDAVGVKVWKLVKMWFLGSAAVLRRIHEIGVDFEAHLQNYAWDLAESRIVAYDLDRLVLKSELNEKVLAMYRFRDLMSLVSSVINYFFFSGLGQICFKGDEEMLNEFKGLLVDLLCEYFGEQIEEKELVRLVDGLSVGAGMKLDDLKVLVEVLLGDLLRVVSGADILHEIKQLQQERMRVD